MVARMKPVIARWSQNQDNARNGEDDDNDYYDETDYDGDDSNDGNCNGDPMTRIIGDDGNDCVKGVCLCLGRGMGDNDDMDDSTEVVYGDDNSR